MTRQYLFDFTFFFFTFCSNSGERWMGAGLGKKESEIPAGVDFNPVLCRHLDP